MTWTTSVPTCLQANTLTIGIFAVLAQHERELISFRTKAALQAKIAQEARLGKPENLTDQPREAATQSLKDKAAANENNRRAAALVQAYQKQRLTWLAIAGKLKRGRIQSQPERGVSGGTGEGFMNGSVIDQAIYFQ